VSDPQAESRGIDPTIFMAPQVCQAVHVVCDISHV
jgi:hypothetical protein